MFSIYLLDHKRQLTLCRAVSTHHTFSMAIPWGLTPSCKSAVYVNLIFLRFGVLHYTEEHGVCKDAPLFVVLKICRNVNSSHDYYLGYALSL